MKDKFKEDPTAGVMTVFSILILALIAIVVIGVFYNFLIYPLCMWLSEHIVGVVVVVGLIIFAINKKL